MMPFQLSYEVPPECPDEAAFVEGVRARLPADFAASARDQQGVISVRVRRDHDGYSAFVDMPAAQGRRVTRVVAGKSCENVIRGSALVTALALEARVTEESAESDASSGAVSAPATSQPNRRLETRAAPPQAAVRPPSLNTPPPVSDQPAAFSLLAGGRGSLTTGVAPAAAFGLGVFVGLRHRSFGVGLTLERVRSGAVRYAGVRAEYALDSARLEAGFSLPLALALELEGLVSFEGGVLGAEALPDPPTVVEGERGTVAWLSPGAGLRLRVFGGPVFVAAEVHGRTPLVQERFFVNVDGVRHVVYRVPFFSVGGAVTVGARF